MYRVRRTKKHIIVQGPCNQFITLKATDIGIVLRPSVHLPFEDVVPCAVPCADMTDAEIVGQALEIISYPV